MKSTFRIAAALAAAALTIPALASDPTQPEVANPVPAIMVLHGSGRAQAEALNADPTWPRTEAAAPAVEVPRLAGEAVASGILRDEPMASAIHEPAPSRLAVP